MRRRKYKWLGWFGLFCFAVSLWFALSQNAAHGIRDAEDPVLGWGTPLWLGFYHVYVFGHPFEYSQGAYFFLIIALVASAIWVMFSIRAARMARSFTLACMSCGYNLTANASGVCPECGTAVSGKSETKRSDVT